MLIRKKDFMQKPRPSCIKRLFFLFLIWIPFQAQGQNEITPSLTILPDTVVAYGDLVKFTVRLDYTSSAQIPLFGKLYYRCLTPLGLLDSLSPQPSSEVIIGSGGFVNTTFFLPVTPSAFLAGGGGNPIVIWPVVLPDSSLTPGNVVVKDSVLLTLYVMPLESGEMPQTPFRFYPNPARHFVWIQNAGQSKWLHITLTDAWGRPQLVHFAAETGLQGFSIEALPQGLYFLTVHWADGRADTRKLLIVRGE
ncbi:MAG: T9SS type A sorting domain-containing protein [Flavobacteriales bacterium]|nr:T9SS type A sorting domain-containing protein [Flavobacteriales bacterium]MDW8433122.1 T9SS type A sorting domain-containing protein [Flavobacteriales bacterium]